MGLVMLFKESAQAIYEWMRYMHLHVINMQINSSQSLLNRCQKPATAREIFGKASATVQRALFNEISKTNVPSLRLSSRTLQKAMVESENGMY